MRNPASTIRFSLLLCGCLAFPPSAQAYEDRAAEVILKDLDEVKMPDLGKVDRKDQASVEKFIAERNAAMSKKSDLIGELYKVAPDNEKIIKLLPERWQSLLMSGPATSKTLKEETSSILAHSKFNKLKIEAAYFATVAAIRGEESEKAQLAATESFIKLAAEDKRGAMLLYSIASGLSDEPAKIGLFKRIIKDYPKTQFASMVEGTMKQLESVGKPFKLDFTDAIKGTEVSMKSTLKGKVVVIDFWATWCGPCIQEMPTMKKLYAEYHDKGVEFVGVSLDSPKEEGGLDELKAYVAKNEVPWPQYYQGNGWDSEFSKSWGINSIPALFVVDADGNLFSINGRGKLEEMLPALLKKVKGTTDTGAGGN